MRSSPASQAGLVAVAFAVATALALGENWPRVDLAFVGVLLSFLLLLTQYVCGSVLRARRARLRERQVVAVAPSEAARRAVEDERARLSAEIDRSVRRSLLAVRGLVTDADEAEDPRPALVQMQRESRSAMAELRRQLGLLGAGSSRMQGTGSQSATPQVSPVGASVDADRHAAPAAVEVLGRRDVILTAAVVGLSLVEMLLLPGQTGSVLMSTAMALTVLVRRVALVPAALACATILLLGSVTDAHVGDGAFYPVVVGLLLWQLLEPRPTAAFVATAVALYACAVATRFVHDPSNAPITIVTLTVVAGAALVVGHARRSRARAERRSRTHEATLGQARDSAARDTRREVARELHDVVSHAVSLVAVQAGATELAWPHDPAATRAGLHAIDAAVITALSELDAQSWDDRPAASWADVERTVGRLRDAGLQVRLDAPGQRPPDRLLPVVHRLVQEALTNVLKHAEGATAYVSVSSDTERTVVEVIDDGPGRAEPRSGYGLVGLEDRVGAVGGTLRIGPGRDGGLRVRAVLPHEPAGVRGPVSA